MKIVPLASLVLVAVVATVSPASAGPTTRFGLTFGLGDHGGSTIAPIGPLVAFGARLGPLLAEVDYAYLVLAPDTARGSMHRLGVNVRADLYRETGRPCTLVVGCTRGKSLFGEAGIAERYVTWTSGEGFADDRYRQREAHVGVGLELDNRIEPNRYGWQLGVRLVFAPRDVVTAVSARTVGEPPPAPSSLETSVMLEWTFLIGH